MKNEGSKPSAEARLRSFIGRFDSRLQKLMRSGRAALLERFPTANELAYDYGHSVVLAYSPSVRGIEAAVSLALREDGVRLHFMNGPRLADPDKLLRGSARQTRFIPLESSKQLATPAVKALIAAAVDLAKVPMPSTGKGTLVIKSDCAAKKSARRPAPTRRTR